MGIPRHLKMFHVFNITTTCLPLTSTLAHLYWDIIAKSYYD